MKSVCNTFLYQIGMLCWIHPVLMTDWAGEAQEPCVLPQAVQMSPHTPLTPTILQEKRIIPTAICVRENRSME